MSTGSDYANTSAASRPMHASGATTQSFKTWSSIDREPHVMGASSLDPLSKAIGAALVAVLVAGVAAVVTAACILGFIFLLFCNF